MTMRKKLLITIACLSVILCTLITGTIAWLTDKTEPVKNTFSPSNIGISLTETEDLDLKMVPGKAITKDPKVTVKANSETCWLFVKIEKSSNFDDFMEYAVATGWVELNDVSGVFYREVSNSTADQEFAILTSGSVTINDKVYSWGPNQVLVLPNVTKTMMDGLYVNGAVNADAVPTLSFTAYACQKEGFNDAAAAWAEASTQATP